MPLSQSLLPEFDHEMADTRRTLERVPEDKLAWKPHAKSSSMGDLATHLANLPRWMPMTLDHDSLDLGAPAAQPSKAATSRRQLLEMFDAKVAEARASLAAASDAQLMGPWTLLDKGRTLLTMPRVAVVRAFILSHTIHHRAQLGVYLRLNDVAVPSIYGPSADENPFA